MTTEVFCKHLSGFFLLNFFLNILSFPLFFVVVFVTTGPFSGCHNSADPGPFYTACIYDLCANLPDDSNLCNSLEEYASLCRSRGGEPDNWRDLTSQCRKYFWCDQSCVGLHSEDILLLNAGRICY